MCRLREKFKGVKVLIGVDRLDYIKVNAFSNISSEAFREYFDLFARECTQDLGGWHLNYRSGRHLP